MATIKELKTKIENANSLGKEKLAEHGIELGAAATTRDIVNSIAEIPPLKYSHSVAELFKGAQFPEGCELTFNIPKAIDISSVFDGASGIKKVALKGRHKYEDCAGIECSYTFANCQTLEVIDLTDFRFAPANADRICYKATALREIKGVVDTTFLTSASFAFFCCYALEEIRFSPNHIYGALELSSSSLLSAETIQSIVDGLMNMTATGYLYLHSDVIGKITDEQKAAINAKGWTLVLND